MASPIIIDDCGSTRVRYLKNDATMDGLIGTFVLATASVLFQDQSHPADLFPNPCAWTIHYHSDPSGAQHAITPAPLVPGDTVQIASDNGHTATVEFLATLRLRITLANPGGGGDPIVDAKHRIHRRTYTVANAGLIQTVSVNGVQVLGPAIPRVYTMMHFG